MFWRWLVSQDSGMNSVLEVPFLVWWLHSILQTSMNTLGVIPDWQYWSSNQYPGVVS